MGSFMLVWFGAPDSEKAFTALATAGNEFTTWTGDVPENRGFAAFETDRYKLMVVDEDDVAPCQLFDLSEDPDDDHNLVVDPHATVVLDELMAEVVEPFLATSPARPHPSLFHRRRLGAIDTER